MDSEHIDFANRRYDIAQMYSNGKISNADYQRLMGKYWLLNRLLKKAREANGIILQK